MVMTKPVGRTFLVLCFKCFCKDKSSPALMKFCWAPEMAREMGRRGVSLRTSKGREDYRCWRFLQKYSFTFYFVVSHTDDSKVLERMAS